MKKKRKTGRDPNSMVPFVFSGTVILLGGLGMGYYLNSITRLEQSNDAAALVLGASIVISGVLFIAAWAKRK